MNKHDLEYIIGLVLIIIVFTVIYFVPFERPKIYKPKYTDSQLSYFLGCIHKGFELSKTTKMIKYVDQSCWEEMLNYK